MAMELELGILISKLIPYEGAEIHLVPGDPGVGKGAIEGGLSTPERMAAAKALTQVQFDEGIAAITDNAKLALLR